MEIHGLSMLNCLITIGDEDPNDTLHILNKITVNEVVNLQIKDSYQTLINTATVEFTRQITIKSSLKDEFPWDRAPASHTAHSRPAASSPAADRPCGWH